MTEKIVFFIEFCILFIVTMSFVVMGMTVLFLIDMAIYDMIVKALGG